MKVVIEKRDLITLIGKTQNVVEKKNTMPILAHILLEAKGSELNVFATDLEVSLTDHVPCQVEQVGKSAVSARSLFEITKELADGPIMLTKKENHWLEIKQGRYQSKIVGLSADDYPVFPTHGFDNKFTMTTEGLKEMIDKTVYSVSTDETRYHLNGVFFELKTENMVSMVATDGHRMSYLAREINDQLSKTNIGVIIPRKGLNEIRKLVENSEGNCQLAIDGSQIVVQLGTTTLMIRLIEGKYPHYQQFFPQKLRHKALIQRDEFLTSLKRVSLLANAKSKAITIQLSPGKMEISSNNPDLGDAREELEIQYDGEPLKIGYNAKYIQEVLTAINEEVVEFEINDSVSPGLIKPKTDTNYLCVVMPMRI